MFKFKSKSWKRKMAIILLPAIAIAATATSIFFVKNNEQVLTVKGSENDKVVRRVYVLSSNNLVVPLTVNLEQKDDIGEELLQVLSLIKEGSPLMEKGYKHILPKTIAFNRLRINKKILTIDFNQEFKNYSASTEARMLEAIVWTCTQFDEVDGVVLAIDGEELKNLPVNNYPLTYPLTRQIGINNQAITSSNPYTTIPVINYYQKVINGEMIYLPLTKRVQMEENSLNTITNQVFNPVSSIEGFKKPEFLKKVYPTEPPVLVNKQLTIDLNSFALEDETSVSKEIFNYLYISFIDVENVEKVVITVEGEMVQISGYDINITDIEVANVYYNTIQL